MQPTSATEYKKGKTKLLKLKTGNVFRIRKMPARVYADLIEMLGLEIRQGIPREQVEAMLKEKTQAEGYNVKSIRAMVKIVPQCILEPKMTFEPSNDPDTLWVDDIEPQDLFELFKEIVEFSGIQEMGAENDKFREQSDGKVSG